MPDNLTYAELAERFPNEYATAMTGKTDEEGEDNSHAGFQPLMESPAKRDVSGAIIELVDEDDPEKTDVALKCVACKTSRFMDFYEKDGLTAYTDRILDADSMKVINGEYWDCYSCHVVKDGQWVNQANAAWANEKFAPNVSKFMQSLNPKEAVCVQCHNTVSPRAYITDEATQASYDPYRYGPGLDERYKAMVEDGIYVTDEATGVKMVTMNHPQIEVFQGSNHQAMGLTCIDCHMTQAEAEDGSTYTSHNASGSVAENDAAMEKCLTCHTNKSGVSTVEEMRAFLKENQAAQAQRHNEVPRSSTRSTRPLWPRAKMVRLRPPIWRRPRIITRWPTGTSLKSRAICSTRLTALSCLTIPNCCASVSSVPTCSLTRVWNCSPKLLPANFRRKDPNL